MPLLETSAFPLQSSSADSAHGVDERWQPMYAYNQMMIR